MKITIFLILLVFVISVAVGINMPALRERLKTASRVPAFKRRKILTENEREFFGRLVAALPDHYVFPQVAMSALLESASRDAQRNHSDRLRIAQQRVDYVICDTDCEIVAVVELDDKTHNHSKDQVRDSRLLSVGIRTVRFQSRAKPTVDTMRSMILGVDGTKAAAKPASPLRSA